MEWFYKYMTVSVALAFMPFELLNGVARNETEYGKFTRIVRELDRITGAATRCNEKLLEELRAVL